MNALDLGVKLMLHGLIVLKGPAEEGGDGRAAFILNASGRHTQMLGINHHGNVICSEKFAQRFCDLTGEPFLDLGAFGIVIHNAIELAETHHALSWNVCHMSHAHDGKEMMFAGGVEGDVPLNEHVVVAIAVAKRLHVRVIGRIQPPEDFLDVHLGHSVRSSGQTVIRQVKSKDVHDVPKFGFDGFDFGLVAQRKGVLSKRRVNRCANVIISNHIVVMRGLGARGRRG